LEKRHRRGMLSTLSAVSALRGLRDNLRLVVWQPFAISLGLDMGQVGSLESLMDATRLALEPALGVVSDAQGRRKLVILREALIVGAGAALLLAHSWQLLFLSSLLVGASMAFYSVWNTVIAESTASGRLGFVYSITSSFYTGAGLVGTLAAGYVADAYGFGWAYTAVIVAGSLSLGIVVLRLPETMAGDRRKLDIVRTVTAPFRALLPPKMLLGFYLAMALDSIAFGIGLRLLNGMLAEGYGYTPLMIGFYSAAMTAAMALSQVPVGRLADRFGYRNCLFLSQVIASLTLGMMVYSKTFEWVFGANLVLGIATAFWVPAEQAWIAENVDPEERAQSLGNYSTFRGLAGLPAPIVGGFLFDAYGFNVPIALNIVLALVDAAVILMLVKDRRRVTSG
jgi:MFS family permease